VEVTNRTLDTALASLVASNRRANGTATVLMLLSIFVLTLLLLTWIYAP
jgi:hypothetical protein